MFGRPLRGVAFDVAVSALVALVSLTAAVNQPGGWAATLVGVAMAAALVLRRTHPSAVTVVVAALALVQVIAGWGPLVYDIAVLIALYSVVKYGERLRDGVVAGAVAAVGVLLAAAQTPHVVQWWITALWYALVTGAVWLVALNVRTRRLYVLSLEERATTLEREREAESRAAVAEERTRIARELHDVVAHSMAVMIVQADGARFMLDRTPDRPRPRSRWSPTPAGRHWRRCAGWSAYCARRPGCAAGPTSRGGRRPEHRRWPGRVPDLLDPVPRRRPADRGCRHGRAAGPAPGAGADRLPGGAGGADQRAQARRVGAGVEVRS